MATQNEGFHFEGIDRPNTTPMPDVYFDEVIPQLPEAEVKILIYIVRRTFGFKKQSDPISFNQFLRGITTRDGRVLDRGCGLKSRSHLSKALKSLEGKGIITSHKSWDDKGENQTTVYSLRFKGEKKPDDVQVPKVVPQTHYGSARTAPSVVPEPHPQQTVLQETVKQKTGVVVVNAALENFGVSKNVAEQLAKAYPEEYLLEKLELVEWLVNTKSPLVTKNPAGYLRQAIEDDYKPPRKYKSRVELAREEEESHQREAADQQARMIAEEEYKLAREAARQRLLEQHPPHPVEDTDLTTETAWGKTLASLETQVPASTYATWLKDTLLLKLEQDTAFVLVNSRFAGEWLERRLYQLITRTLEQVVGQPMELEFVTSQPAMEPT